MPRTTPSSPSPMGDRLAEFVAAGDQLWARMYREAREVDRLDPSARPADRLQLAAALRRLRELGDELAGHTSRHREILKLD